MCESLEQIQIFQEILFNPEAGGVKGGHCHAKLNCSGIFALIVAKEAFCGLEKGSPPWLGLHSPRESGDKLGGLFFQRFPNLTNPRIPRNKTFPGLLVLTSLVALPEGTSSVIRVRK